MERITASIKHFILILSQKLLLLFTINQRKHEAGHVDHSSCSYTACDLVLYSMWYHKTENLIFKEVRRCF